LRSLIYVPIIHSEADLGSVGGVVRERYQEAFGKEAWQRRFSSVDAMWEGLTRKVLALPLDWNRTRLYQDGLPVCGREIEIVRDLARQGSRNHQILLAAVDRGARLMGTESAPLIVAEYRRVQKLIQASRLMESESDAVALELRAEGERLLRERDAYIATRIGTTLEDGETALLFIGLLHRVDDLLGDGYEVHHVIHSLPFGAEPGRVPEDRGGHAH
jgi:hypothetical protein